MIRHPLFVLLIGLLCVPLFLYLLPNIEESRNEARIAQAYNEVCRLSRSSGDEQVPIPDADNDEADVVDPWGQPYRWAVTDDDSVRVVSSGPNMTFTNFGLDADDIYSDMPDSPVAARQAVKRRQILLAFVVALGVWLFFSIPYWQSRRRFHD